MATLGSQGETAVQSKLAASQVLMLPRLIGTTLSAIHMLPSYPSNSLRDKFQHSVTAVAGIPRRLTV